MIRAISFDLWDTVIHDDSDEPKRAAQGLRPKSAERRHLAWEALNAVQPIEAGAVSLAYDVAEAAFSHVWHEQHITWAVSERVRVLLAGLKRELPEAARARLVERLERMELEVMPDPVAGVHEAIAALAERYRLGVVSDAIYTPGRCLREWLERNGLLGYFSGFAFSDEVGHAKPHRAMFDSVAEQLDVRLDEIVHLGDRDHNDVQGPHALGMKAILFTGTRDRDRHITTADAVCERHADLVATVERLTGC